MRGNRSALDLGEFVATVASSAIRVGNRAYTAVFVTLFVAGIGNSFVFAVLPPLGREMGLSEAKIGLIVSISAFVFMLAAPWWGHRSEHWGRRRVILLGLSGYGILTILFAVAIQLRLNGAIAIWTAFVALVVLRAVFSLCIAGIFPASQAYLADITTTETRTAAMGFYGMAMGSGMIAGPAVAAAFSGINLLAPFYAVAALSVLAGWCMLAWVTEPERHTHEDVDISAPANLRAWLPHFLVSTVVMASMSAIQQSSGFYFQDKFTLDAAHTARLVGLALTVSAIASVFSQMWVVRRLGWQPSRLLRTGVPVSAVGISILVFGHTYPLLVIGLTIFGLGQGMTMPGNIAALSMTARSHEQGRAAGLNTSALGLGFVIGPTMGSLLFTIHPLAPYSTCLVLFLLMIVHVRVNLRHVK